MALGRLLHELGLSESVYSAYGEVFAADFPFLDYTGGLLVRNGGNTRVIGQIELDSKHEESPNSSRRARAEIHKYG